MGDLKSIFSKRKVVMGKLEPFGFCRTGGAYTYKRTLPGSGFLMTVTVTGTGEVCATVVDPSLSEPYTLHLAGGAAGSFVGGVRAEYEGLLTEISEGCFEPDIFKSGQAKSLIEYVRARYGGELEFLWEKFPDNAVWRRSDTAKWYGALLTVSKRKLGIRSDEVVEIIDLRTAPENMDSLIDNRIYFPGWHMNKRNWYTVILNGSAPLEELQRRLDESYLLAVR